MRNRLIAAALSVAALAVGCGQSPSPAVNPSAATTGPQPTEAGAPEPSQAPGSLEAEVTPKPVGFAFAADDVLAYYESNGYVCSPPTASTTASGYQVRTCSLVDPIGRTVTVGLVTDPTGALGNAFASVQAADSEDLVEPVAALDPLSGFLGAMLGGERVGTVVEWLAAHVGDPYAETSDGGLRIATYTPAEDDLSAIYVELADQAYLDAPQPSGE